MKLREFRYSPGYSDMRGASHSERLKKNDQGSWVIVCSDRDSHNSPMISTVYATSPEAAAEFEEFINANNIPALADRKESDLFACDYHPWSVTLVFESDSNEGYFPATYFSFDQYKEFTGKDMELIKELRERFRALRGAIISKTTEKDDR